MQNGSLIRRARHSQSEVWEFRWREPGPTGTRRHRRIVVGSTDQIANESEARQAVAALQIEISTRRDQCSNGGEISYAKRMIRSRS
jgi:hypothetical protein